MRSFAAAMRDGFEPKNKKGDLSFLYVRNYSRVSTGRERIFSSQKVRARPTTLAAVIV